MVNRLFGDAGEPGILGQIRYVAVHLSIYLDILHDLVAVGLQSAVHVVEPDARDPSRGGIVKLGRKILGQGIVLPVLLPAGNDVPALFCNEPVHLRYLVRGVLEVGVHCHDNIAGGLLETVVEGGRLAVVPAETDSVDAGVTRSQLPDCVPGTVRAAVVHHYDLVFPAVLEHYLPDPGCEFRKGFLFIEKGNDDRNVRCHDLFSDWFLLLRFNVVLREDVPRRNACGEDLCHDGTVDYAIYQIREEGDLRVHSHRSFNGNDIAVADSRH